MRSDSNLTSLRFAQASLSTWVPDHAEIQVGWVDWIARKVVALTAVDRLERHLRWRAIIECVQQERNCLWAIFDEFLYRRIGRNTVTPSVLSKRDRGKWSLFEDAEAKTGVHAFHLFQRVDEGLNLLGLVLGRPIRLGECDLRKEQEPWFFLPTFDDDAAAQGRRTSAAVRWCRSRTATRRPAALCCAAAPRR